MVPHTVLKLKTLSLIYNQDQFEHWERYQTAQVRGVSLNDLDLEMFEGTAYSLIGYRDHLMMCISKMPDPFYWSDALKVRLEAIEDDIRTLEAKCIGLGGKAIPHHLR